MPNFLKSSENSSKIGPEGPENRFFSPENPKISQNIKIFARREYDWQRVDRRRPCPVCGGKDWCEVSADGQTVHCMRTPGDRAVDWRGGGWLHQFGSEFRVPSSESRGRKQLPITTHKSLEGEQAELSVKNSELRTQNSELRTPALRAAAINWLLGRLELSVEHLAYLEEEDLTDLVGSGRLMYRTLPGDMARRKELLAGLEAEFGREVCQGLGFVYERRAKAGGFYLEFAGVLRGVDALLIPVRDAEGQPVALKARSVDPATGARHYRAMSAGNTELGVSIGTPIHVARPAEVAPGLEKWVVVTEGEKKADYVAERLGVVVLGVQGVSSWRSGKLLPLLGRLGVEQVVEAFDADRDQPGKRGKENIERQARQLCEQCAAAGFRVFTARWELQSPESRVQSPESVVGYGKGLDDFLRSQKVLGASEFSWPTLYRFKPNLDINKEEAELSINDPSINMKASSNDASINMEATDNEQAEPSINKEENTQSSALSTQHSDFEQRYGLSRDRAGRIAGQFVEVDSDTMDLKDESRTPIKGVKDEPELDSTLPDSSLQNARLELARLFGGAFAEHIQSKGQGTRRILLRTTTGTGKTTAAYREIIQHLAMGRPGRVAFLTDTKQAYAHLFGPDGLLEEARQAGRVAIREGRTDAPGEYHCERLADCSVLGANRQPASVDACAHCPFGSAASWKENAASFGFDPNAPRHFECEKYGYLASVKRCKEAQVVIAPKAAILNGSSELAEFDFIIIDEDCLGFLLECQELAPAQLATWEEGRRRLEARARLKEELEGKDEGRTPIKGVKDEFDTALLDEDEEDEEDKTPLHILQQRHAPFDKLFNLIKNTLTDFELAATLSTQHSALSTQHSVLSRRARFLPLLLARAEAEGVDLGQLVAECLAVRPSSRFKRYRWEKPYRNHLRGVMVAPLRFARDLVELLERELDVAEGGDTRLWVERRTGDEGGAVLTAYLPRQHLLDILRGEADSYHNEFQQPATVFFLDATAGPLFRLAVPGVEEVEIKVPQPLYVIQTTNSLYTARALQNNDGKALGRISRAIDALVQRFGATRPVVFSRKAFNPDQVPGSGFRVPSLEDKNKPLICLQAGTNLTQNSELGTRNPSVRYGHFERHNKGLDDYADCDLLCIVGHYSQPLDELTAQVEAFRGRKHGLEAAERGGSWQLKPYLWREQNGKGLARWCKSHPDPDIQAAIEHSTVATVMQTIGRGRAALRPGDKPLVVALFNSLPLPNLEINELTDVADILEEGRISERQAAALAAGRDEFNARRQAGAVERIEATKTALKETGRTYVPLGSFAKMAGVSRGTLHRLGYGWYGRWVRVTNIRDTFSQAMYISYISTPERNRLENLPGKREKTAKRQL
jgi:hypothetical protein